MDKCPYCGSTQGVYKTYTGMQYYDFNGVDAGYYADVTENQKEFARCIHCERKISLSRIKREAEKRNKTVNLEDIVDLEAQTKANNEAMRKVIAFMVGERKDDDKTNIDR